MGSSVRRGAVSGAGGGAHHKIRMSLGGDLDGRQTTKGAGDRRIDLQLARELCRPSEGKTCWGRGGGSEQRTASAGALGEARARRPSRAPSLSRVGGQPPTRHTRQQPSEREHARKSRDRSARPARGAGRVAWEALCAVVQSQGLRGARTRKSGCRLVVTSTGAKRLSASWWFQARRRALRRALRRWRGAERSQASLEGWRSAERRSGGLGCARGALRSGGR